MSGKVWLLVIVCALWAIPLIWAITKENPSHTKWWAPWTWHWHIWMVLALPVAIGAPELISPWWFMFTVPYFLVWGIITTPPTK